MLINYLSILGIGFLAAVFLVKAVMVYSLRKGLLLRHGIPSTAGLGIALAFVFSCLAGSFLFRGLTQKASGIILSSLIMFIFGLVDDLKELPVHKKFLVEIIATSCLVLFGVRTNIVYLGNALNIIITFIWVIGITNAINHLDVMDGLAGGITWIAAASFFLIASFTSDLQSQIISLSLVGTVSGFLLYNFPAARVYMGNAGSHFLGFVLAGLSLNISYANLGKVTALLSPLLILGFPIFDTAFLIIVRTAQGKSALLKSDDHLALRFLKLGYSKKKTLALMLILALFFSSAGILLSGVPNALGIFIIVFMAVVSIALVKKMGFSQNA
ncbi:MAG: MraY family glycosyltransferase [Candidatus Omnitrophica bacterium]|nr:MraY family glycosyltransferase [Candidatus Omnitrophota bacterium]MDD5236048.1 MraY family glycosyltransferase [Candidatus Omnitrophota bacterium]MDD5609922.1 MraY family glycosyltransferase [Candidatus Omnitrophota bacterium]